MTFHENLFHLRTEQKLTQQQVADGAGLSLRGYQNYERGLREPPLSTLIALADFYDLSLDELVCRERGRSPAAESCPDASCNPERK